MNSSETTPGEPNDPFARYARLRLEAPVYHEPSSDVWIVSRYAETALVLRSFREFSARTLGGDSFEIRPPEGGCPLLQEETLLASDPPTHTQLRRHLGRFFASEHIVRYAEDVRTAVREVVNAVGPTGVCDVIQDVCVPIISRVLTELFGLAPHRSADVARWMRICGQSNARSRPAWLKPAFDGMLAELWAAAKEEGSRREGRCLGALMAAHTNSKIHSAQVLDLCVTLMKGSAETIGHLTGNTLLTLQAHTGLIDHLRTYPEQIPAFIEESLRFDSPVQMTVRQTTSEVEIAGIRLPQGARVLALIGSANRDERVFQDPNLFDPRRSARGHLAFGTGAHQCPGAALARLVVTSILDVLLSERPHLRILTESFQPVERAALWGPERLLLTFGPFAAGRCLRGKSRTGHSGAHGTETFAVIDY